MKNFWDQHEKGDRKLLRLLTNEGTWLAWNDEEGEDKTPSQIRTKDRVEAVLQSALNSTNTIVLLGSGASFSAKNRGLLH